MISPQTTKPYDLVRTLRMASIGLIFVGPSMHFWFNTVSKVLPKRDIATTLIKIVMGQTIFGPAMTSGFFSVNAGLQGITCYLLSCKETSLANLIKKHTL